MKEEIIENEQIEEKPKAKRTRKKKAEETQKPETVEVEETQKPETVEVEETQKPETVEVEETKKPKKAAESVSKAVVDEKTNGYYARVVTALLNVREKPSKASKAIHIISANEIVEIVEDFNGWGKLSGEGYVMLDYIERIDD